MSSEHCPLPAVAEALDPYIKPRDKVDRIRIDLQSHIARHAREEGTTLSFVSLAGPSAGPVGDISPSITRVRKAYLKALQAHAAAQTRYDALKADLAQVAADSPVPSSTAWGASQPPVNESYIPLLRQREKRRKLQVIENSYSKITEIGKGTVYGHLDDILKQQAGDLPTPPTNQAPAFNEKPDVESRILQLKKAVLSTHRTVNANTTTGAVGQIHDTPNSIPAGEVAGLQSALNELTGWMEQQLAIIGSSEADGQAMPATSITNGHARPEVASLADIEALYKDYLSARQRLVQTITHPPASDAQSSSPRQSAASANATKPQPQRLSPAEALLPHVESLTSAKQQERSLLQQTHFVRRQIAASESETQRLIARLADESHLVHPGASRGEDWAAAATEVGKATAEYAKLRIQAAQESAAAARGTLGEVRGVPGLLDGFVGSS